MPHLHIYISTPGMSPMTHESNDLSWLTESMDLVEGEILTVEAISNEACCAFWNEYESAMDDRCVARMLAFARQHDWGYDARVHSDGASIIVGCDVFNAEGELLRSYTQVETLAQLRNWAGY